ncbi:MAG: NAD(+)--rifampin ADP-ribosyltransferase [Acidimicrobiales bacterium]
MTAQEHAEEANSTNEADVTEYRAVTFDRCDHVKGPFFHGTKNAFKVGEEIVPGHLSNYHDGRVAHHVYFSALLEPAVWGAELATALAVNREGVALLE